MGAVVIVLAVLGGAAVVVRLARTLLQLAIDLSEVATVSGRLEIALRRGDLTGLAEGKEQRARLRDLVRRRALLALGWLLVLAVPTWTGSTRYVYAAAVLLWLVPAEPLRIPPRPER